MGKGVGRNGEAEKITKCVQNRKNMQLLSQNTELCCIFVGAPILVRFWDLIFYIFLFSGVPLDQFACVHKFHSFLEVHCSSYQQRAVQLRLIALQLEQPGVDVDSFGGKKEFDK